MKQLLVILVLLCSVSVSAQDVIVKKDGSTVVCRVVELTSTEITYKKWNDLNGSNYIMNRNDASAINYQNGKKIDLSEATNLYLPNNQNDGTQKYNDKALLTLNHEINGKRAISKNYKRTATITRVVGWGIGAAAVGVGVYFAAFATGHSHYTGMGIGIAAGGVAFTTGCLLLANYFDKKSKAIESASVYQYDLKFDNGSSLSAGVDMIQDHNIDYRTLGLGLRYNF